MKKETGRRIETGVYKLIASFCLLLLIFILTSKPVEDILLLVRVIALSVLLVIVYKLYVWLKKEE